MESQNINKMISDILQKFKYKHEKQNTNIVNITIFIGKVRWSKIKAFPDPDEIKTDHEVSKNLQNHEIV